MDANTVYCYYNGTPLALPKQLWMLAKAKGESAEYCAPEELDRYKKQLDKIEDGITRACAGGDIGDQEARLKQVFPTEKPVVLLLAWVMNIAALIKTKRLKDDEQNGWLYKIERGPNEVQLVVGADTTSTDRMGMVMAGLNRRQRRAMARGR